MLVSQLELFEGVTYEAALDYGRLSTQLAKVFTCMKDSKWRTLSEIQEIIRCGSEAGISARLRDLRKSKWGEHTINRRRRGTPELGLWEYQLVPRN